MLTKTRKTRKLAVVESKVYDNRRMPAATESVAGDKILARLTDKANQHITQAGEEKQRFFSKFDQDPARGLEWSRDVFQVAGRLSVYQGILKWISDAYAQQVDEYTLVSNFNLMKSIRNELNRDVIHGAKYPEFSTSPTSNLIAVYKLAAKAEILEDLDRWFDFHDHGFDSYY